MPETASEPQDCRRGRLQSIRGWLAGGALAVFMVLSMAFMFYEREYEAEHITLVASIISFVAGWVSAAFGFYFASTDNG